MWNFRPPRETAEIRLEQRAYGEGIKVGGVNLVDRTTATERMTYLLRSINIHGRLGSDILVAFRVESKLDDGSFVIVWKLLKKFDTPTAED